MNIYHAEVVEDGKVIFGVPADSEPEAQRKLRDLEERFSQAHPNAMFRVRREFIVPNEKK